MSNYQSMKGQYLLTSSDIKKVHTGLRRKYNAHQEQTYLNLVNVYESLGGSSGINKLLKDNSFRYGFSLTHIDYKTRQILIDLKGKKPLKKDFCQLSTSRSDRFYDDDENLVYFDGNTIKVQVDENNRAVDCFLSGFLWSALVSELKQLKWSRKDTGGCLYYIDEFIRDDDYYATRPVHLF
jgi:hypothetical protein